MKAEIHRERALRIERSQAKCGPEDFEMRIEAAMLASTHWLNFILHRMSITPAGQDVMHTYLLTVNDLRRYRIEAARFVDALTEIEDLRPAFVRGNWPGGEAAAARAMELQGLLRQKADELT